MGSEAPITEPFSLLLLEVVLAEPLATHKRQSRAQWKGCCVTVEMPDEAILATTEDLPRCIDNPSLQPPKSYIACGLGDDMLRLATVGFRVYWYLYDLTSGCTRGL